MLNKFMLNTCLIVIDVQNDFCTNGSLEVPNGEAIIPTCNKLISHFDIVICSQDWHCKAHLSFASSYKNAKEYSIIQLPYGSQILWPDHCIQGTVGAKFHSNLNIDKADLILRKGANINVDSYSAFFENNNTTKTGLDGYLKDKNINKVILCGLAFDFCVFWTALDAVKCGYEVIVISDACKSIDNNGSHKNAKIKMTEAGVNLINFDELIN